MSTPHSSMASERQQRRPRGPSRNEIKHIHETAKQLEIEKKERIKVGNIINRLVK